MKATREAWELHQGRSRIFAFNPASPAGVTEYPVPPRPSEHLSAVCHHPSNSLLARRMQFCQWQPWDCSLLLQRGTLAIGGKVGRTRWHHSPSSPSVLGG